MSNIVLRNASVKGIVLSVALLLCGAVIIFFGARELVLYYAEPVSTEVLQNSFADDTRVQLSSYRVAGVFDMPGYSYFVVEYSERNYCLVETRKDGKFYNDLKAQGRDSITEQNFVIDGYLYHLKDYQLDDVRENMTAKGVDPSQFDTAGRYAVKILTKDYSMVIFGSVVVLSSVAAFVLSKKLFKMEE